MSTITPREQTAILKSLASGLVPQIGLHHLAVGRQHELQALSNDIETIKEGGSTFRLVTGPIGAGKTFLAQVVKGHAIGNGCVVVSADLSVQQRLHATDGRARDLLSALMTNVSTKTSPSGAGLRQLLETWIAGLSFDVGGQSPTPEAMAQRIFHELRPLKKYPKGFEFAQVPAKYYEGHATDNPALQDAALRWLRGEYSRKTDARHDLGIGGIIGDEDLFASLALFSAFCRLAGYSGVLVLLDELSAISFHLPNAVARQGNAQTLLTIANSCLQGGVTGLGFILAGVPEALNDPDRGLFCVPALRSRLQVCAPSGCVDYASPVLQLEPLAREELLVLLHNVRRVHALGDESKYRLPDEGIKRFLGKALSRFGGKALPNPRDVLRPFVSILNVLEQDPNQNWAKLIEDAAADTGRASDAAEAVLGPLKLG